MGSTPREAAWLRGERIDDTLAAINAGKETRVNGGTDDSTLPCSASGTTGCPTGSYCSKAGSSQVWTGSYSSHFCVRLCQDDPDCQTPTLNQGISCNGAYNDDGTSTPDICNVSNSIGSTHACQQIPRALVRMSPRALSACSVDTPRSRQRTPWPIAEIKGALDGRPSASEGDPARPPRPFVVAHAGVAGGRRIPCARPIGPGSTTRTGMSRRPAATSTQTMSPHGRARRLQWIG